MTDKDPEVEQLLNKLSDMLRDDNEVHIFDKNEVATLRKLIGAVRWLETFGTLGKALLSLLILIAAGATAFNQFFGGPS